MAAVLVCLLALEMWAAWAAGVQGPGAQFSQRAQRVARGKVRGPQARSAAQAVALRGRTAGHDRKARKATCSTLVPEGPGVQPARRFRIPRGARAAAAEGGGPRRSARGRGICPPPFKPGPGLVVHDRRRGDVEMFD